MDNIEKILSSMSLEDKVALCEGANFWQTRAMAKYGIPAIFMCDGPHGLRKQELSGGTDMLGVNQSVPATCFPAAVTLAGSWDTELVSEVGAAIGEEAEAMGVALVLGPGANIKRDPLCGRSFEYFSEDPQLAGKLAAAHIRGLQSNGTCASLKHFAANNRETSRFNSDSVMDERTLREIYLAAFETAVKEGRPATVMCAYNKLNGVHCSDSRELLTGILRDEWGFDGLVVTDWGAMNDRVEGFRAGCDLNMPGGSNYMFKEVLDAVKTGKLPETAVDESARRVLRLIGRARKAASGEPGFEAHDALARRAAAEGAVLLQNNGALPIKPGRKIALIGEMARTPRYQGSGSSHINPTRVTSALDAMPGAIFAQGCTGNGDTSPALIDEAIKAARASDVAVVFAGLPGRYESEGFDRENMEMPEGQIQLIEAVAAANPNTVVVLSCGGAVECPWADHVNAVLYMGLPGQAGGAAVSDLLYGRANPSGKLAETWPVKYSDCPASACFASGRDAEYREGIYVGYRYYDKAGVKPRWAFGHGLSYTGFAYSGLKVEGTGVTCTLTNTGSVAGAEVAQLYIAAPRDSIHRPVKELRSFRKVFLQPGESVELSFELTERDFSIWQEGWRVPTGEYSVLVGGGSDSLPLCTKLRVVGDAFQIPAWQPGSWYESPHGAPGKSGWETMLGHVHTETEPQKGKYTMDDTLLDMKEHSFVMRCVYKGVESTVAKGAGGKCNPSDPEFRMLMASSAGAPIRVMQINGAVKGGLFAGLVEIANGHFLRGLVRMIRGRAV